MIRGAGNSSMLGISRRVSKQRWRCPSCRRSLHDGRKRLSEFWTPTGPTSSKTVGSDMSPIYLLYRAGFLQAAYAGIFHLLPLGLRVQEKLEGLIDKHMRRLGASKLSLSSLSSANLWQQSGRLTKSTEMFQITDRRKAKYLLAPTHEEEITQLAKSMIHSYKELPLRLYQISRKYRDERRPRGGLLRGREFLMKDLYTFDYSTKEAMATYNAVRDVYCSLFDDLKLPYMVARADSGNMGGNLSHEYHLPSKTGEDLVISCSCCDYVANEEVAEAGVEEQPRESKDMSSVTRLPAAEASIQTWTGRSIDGQTLINVHYPARADKVDADGKPRGMANVHDINLHLLRRLVPNVDLVRLGGKKISDAHDDAINGKMRVVNIFDFRVPPSFRERTESFYSSSSSEMETFTSNPASGNELNMQRIEEGDLCPRCYAASLKKTTAIEIGHTFFLGTRYSSMFGADVAVGDHLASVPKFGEAWEAGRPRVLDTSHTHSKKSMVPLQMGCHGIGVSRMIAAVASYLADGKGLNWPRPMAPFEVVIIPTPGLEEEAVEIYDVLSQPKNANVDAILDDRDKDMPWKLKDADLIGYPVIIVLGRGWRSNNTCEVQCRRLGIKESVMPENLLEYVDSVLQKL